MVSGRLPLLVTLHYYIYIHVHVLIYKQDLGICEPQNLPNVYSLGDIVQYHNNLY